MSCASLIVFSVLWSASNKLQGVFIQPYLSNPWVDGSGQQQPNAFNTLTGSANRAGIHVCAGAQKIDSAQNVASPDRRQAYPNLVRSCVGQLVAHVWPAVILHGRTPRFELQNDSSGFRDSLGQRSESLPASRTMAGFLPGADGT
jgi:hypothetical protein